MFHSRSVSTRTVRSHATITSAIVILLVSCLPAHAGPGDIVLYASDVTTIRGTWARVSSTTGAGGLLMSSPDAGVRIATALTAPADYFEASFDAPANTAYHIWLRLRAANNSYSNDSVWVQMSDALNPTGSPVWRIGTSSALPVTLEACSGCGVAGWGWADASWWTGDYPVVKFSTTGRHTVRVQTREDGPQIDQIVLSPTTYFTAAPGPAKNDTTIVPKSTTSTSTTTAKEVVLYASDAARRSGNWALQGDTSAALGWRYGSYDYSAPKVDPPLAVPADYVEWTFNASAGTRYRTWLRLNAGGNLPQNDSLWVQFSDAVTSGGAATYRIGTTSALPIGLEACSGCGVSGWGWRNKAFWTSDTGDVYFPTSGTKTIRVQVREDGVRVDQIVLSPSHFLNTPPGPVRGDATLVARDGTTAAIGASSTTVPKTVTFTASSDHHSLVISYLLEVFAAGSNPATALAVAARSLGKPAIASGQITADIGATIQALPAGSYQATVSAVGTGGSSRSIASNTFFR